MAIPGNPKKGYAPLEMRESGLRCISEPSGCAIPKVASGRATTGETESVGTAVVITILPVLISISLFVVRLLCAFGLTGDTPGWCITLPSHQHC